MTAYQFTTITHAPHVVKNTRTGQSKHNQSWRLYSRQQSSAVYHWAYAGMWSTTLSLFFNAFKQLNTDIVEDTMDYKSGSTLLERQEKRES